MVNPNLDIEFSRSSINNYYNNKIQDEKPRLPTTLFESIEDLGRHLKEEHKISFPKNFKWAEDANETQWIFREYAFCTVMLQLPHLLHKQTERYVPEELDIKENTYTVIGSQMISSDIDVTVQGPHAVILIAVIEDMFEFLENKYDIPFSKLDIQFYGDFRILSKLYVNVGKFTDEQRRTMLRYAYISYFRSVKKSNQVSPLARRLGLIFLKKIPNNTVSLKHIIEEATNEWNSQRHMNREQFYLEQEKAELEATLLYNKKANITFLASDIFFSIARANIHRAESYVLPSTAVHVVEMEQVGFDKSEPCAIDKKWFADNACIGVDAFAYIASAIEQCGYLEHYHPAKTQCNKKGVKYFGRLVRGLLHANLLDYSFTSIYKNLNEFRKSEDAVCPYNIHSMIEKILKKIRPSKTRKLKRT
jgi:hypothetical protein